MSRLALLLLLAAALAGLGGSAPARAVARERWRPPLPGGMVAGTFAFDRALPFAPGQRRGVDLRGRPGARVVAACAGRVAHAGRVPGWDRGVSLRCGGGLVATELGLSTLAVRRGAWVLPGAVMGRLGPRGVLRLGARRAVLRHGYLDPLGLLAGAGGAAPPAVAPRGPAGRPPRRAVPPATRPAVPAAPAARARPPALAWPAYAGCALLLTAAGGGTVTVRRRHGRPRTGMALAQR